jgi:predicted deacylase
MKNSLLVGPEAEIIASLSPDLVSRGTIKHFWLHLVNDGLGAPVYIPVIIARGRKDGPVVGLTAAVHGNELNGIPVIQKVFTEIDVNLLCGTVIGVPVVNVPSFFRRKRRFIDGVDLNHIMPGKKNGNVSQVYAYRFMQRVVRQFDYLLDLHTASFGRINSYYIRADLNNEQTKKMALLQNSQIIVNNPPSDGTLRGAAAELGIHAITLEVGNPNLFQKGMIRSSLTGIHNLLVYLGMTEGDIDEAIVAPVICSDSYWLYTSSGGLLSVLPNITDKIKQDQLIGIMRNVFGEVVAEYHAPEDGVVIGKSVSPVNQTGGRILHLGKVVGD